MGGRLALGIATAMSLLASGGLYAQGMAPGQAGYGPGMVSQGPGPFGTYPPPAFGPPASGPPTVAPAGYQAPATNGSGACEQACPGSVYAGMGCGGDQGSDDFVEAPWEETLCRILRNVNVRVDYINWGISRPTTSLIGAQPAPGVLQPFFNDTFFFNNMAVQTNPTEAFPVNGGIARAYDTTGISLSENSGFQVTFTLPMTYGDIEASGFLLGKANSAPNVGGLPLGTPGDQSFAAIPVNVGGKPSDEVALFSQSFNQYYSSFVFGAETNVYFHAIVPKEYGLVIKPMLGFRYLGIDEHFNVIASNPSQAAATVDSTTINNIFGPQAGIRFELLTQWFTLGLEPKVMLGVNDFAASLGSFDPTTGASNDHQLDVRFAPVGALNAYVKVPIQEHIRIYVAYNLLGTTNISRPQEQIDYNVTPGLQNATSLHLANSSIMIQGYSVGVEFNF
jgi:hypothetical protein